MPIRTSGGVFNQQVLTSSLSHYVVCGADFSGATNEHGRPVPNSAAEIIFSNISERAYINIMNPNEYNLSFALEESRSDWDEISLTEMIQALGEDVGVDHIDCSICIVKRVPYIWGCGPCEDQTFLGLLDTPSSYEGAAGQYVTVNLTETGLVFTSSVPTVNAFAEITSTGQSSITASGSDSLEFIAGSNVSIVTDDINKSITINATSSNGDYTPVAAGAILNAGFRFYITEPGTVYLSALTGNSFAAGESITIAKGTGYTVFVNVGDNADIISTDLGTTDSIEMDITQECIFICNGANSWMLQLGSAN